MVKLTFVVLSFWVSVISATIGTYDTPGRHPRSARQSTCGPNDELNQEFWKEQALKSLKDHVARTEKKQRAKNIIMFLGDGMSVSTLTAARIYMGQKEGRLGENDKMSFEKFPVVGLSNTYCVNAQTADSACSATAYLGGVKTNDGTIGVAAAVPYMNCSAMTNEEHFVKSIAHESLEVGMSAGIVTTTRITHASPAGAYAHTSCRDWESDADILNDNEDPTVCRDIAYQLVMDEPGSLFQVIFGGGRRKFVGSSEGGERVDGLNLINSWIDDKTMKNLTHQYVQNKAELLAAVEDDTDYVLGLFHSNHMDYHLLSNETQPTLADMTEAAIKILSRNDEGFFLFVEGGRIDHGHHDSLTLIALDETVEMAKAVDKALELTCVEDTLIVVTSDHSHTMTVAGYPSRGNDILGTSDASLAVDGLPYVTLSYANGPGYRKDIITNDTTARVDITTDPKFLERDPDFRYPAMVPMPSETHAAEDVAVFALGPWQHIFTGSYEQNLIPYLMAYAACLDEDLYNC